MPINFALLVFLITQLTVPCTYAIVPVQPEKGAHKLASDIEIKSYSESILASIYTQTQPHDASSYLAGLESVQSVFDAPVYQKILTQQRNDELMTLAQQNAMVMTQRQNSSLVSIINATEDRNQSWQVTTQIDVYYVKDQIEIVRPLTNTMIITMDDPVSRGYKITAFTTTLAAQPELINYQQLRQKNCPSKASASSSD